jgi:hypothetical protein
MSPFRAWSLLALFLGCITLGAQILPSAADSPFLSSGAAMDRIVLKEADLSILGTDGTRAELHARTLGVEHLSLDDALFTIRRGLVAREATLRTDLGTTFSASTLQLTPTEGHHRWEGPAILKRQGSQVRYEGRGELWLERGIVNVVELNP